jgi:hypothetical protein
VQPSLKRAKIEALKPHQTIETPAKIPRRIKNPIKNDPTHEITLVTPINQKAPVNNVNSG